MLRKQVSGILYVMTALRRLLVTLLVVLLPLLTMQAQCTARRGVLDSATSVSSHSEQQCTMHCCSHKSHGKQQSNDHTGLQFACDLSAPSASLHVNDEDGLPHAATATTSSSLNTDILCLSDVRLDQAQRTPLHAPPFLPLRI